MKTVACLLVIASLALQVAASDTPAAVTGKLVYIAFDDTTSVKTIDLATKNKVETVFTFYSGNYPQWSESSAANETMLFYSFVNSDGFTGTTIGFDLPSKSVAFNVSTLWFWRLGYAQTDPTHVVGLWIGDNNVYATRVDITDGTNVTYGHFPDGFTSPSNSAVYDSATDIFYAFLSNGSTTMVFGMSAEGHIVSHSMVDQNIEICECVKDDVTGKFYTVVQDGNSNAWLGHFNPKNGVITPVGKAKYPIQACDADGALSATQNLYFAYVKSNEGSEITVWNLNNGDLVEHFVVENAVFGMQFFES